MSASDATQPIMTVPPETAPYATGWARHWEGTVEDTPQKAYQRGLVEGRNEQPMGWPKAIVITVSVVVLALTLLFVLAMLLLPAEFWTQPVS